MSFILLAFTFACNINKEVLVISDDAVIPARVVTFTYIDYSALIIFTYLARRKNIYKYWKNKI